MFKDCKSIEDAKKLYRKLAMENHPDHGGDADEFKRIDRLFREFIENFVESARAEFKEERGWNPDMTPFVDVLQKVMNLNCRIEVIGIWIYAFESLAVKEELKALGFWFSGKYKAWIFSGQKKRSVRSKYTLDDVKSMHGSIKIKDKDDSRQIA